MLFSKFKVIISFLTLMTVTHLLIAKDSKPIFSLCDIGEARNIASKDDKLIIVDFCASWCKPCQWMEKTTFANEKVEEFLSSNFVTVKIDIDELQGFEMKKIYDVKFLPTILVFNSKGELLDRKEQTMSPHTMLKWLETYNTPLNKNVIKHNINLSPTYSSEEQRKNSFSDKSDNGIENYINDSKSKPSFKVQVGVFKSYDVAEDMVKNMRKFFAEPVTVAYEYDGNTPIFKVRVGQFFEKSEAEYFLQVMKNDYNLEGLVI